MLRALGIIFLVLLVMLTAVGGGFLSHFLTRMNSPQVQNHQLGQVNHSVSPGGYPANYESAPLPFPQSSQMQAVPIQPQLNQIPVNVTQTPVSQHSTTLRQVKAVTAASTQTMLAPAVALQAAVDNTFKITQVECDGDIIWKGDGLLNHGKKEVLIKSGGPLTITIENNSSAVFTSPNDIKSFTLTSPSTDNKIESAPPVLFNNNKNIKATFNLGTGFQAGPYSLGLETNSNLTWKEEGQKTNIVYPNTSLKPTISFVSVHQYENTDPSFVSTNIYEIYDGYLRVKLSSASGKEKFILVNDNQVFVKEIEVLRRQRFTDSSDVWQYELNVPLRSETSGTIYALHEQDSSHAYSDNGIKVKGATYIRDGLVVTTQLVQTDDEKTPLNFLSENNYFTNQTEFEIEFTFRSTGGGNANGSQLVVHDSKGTQLAVKNVPDSTGSPQSVEIPVDLISVGKYTLVPSLMQGNQVIDSVKMNPIQVSIATEGPIKGIVDASTFSQIPSANEFTISFDKNYPLDKSKIEDDLDTKYSIAKEGGNPANLAISSAEYLAPSNAIKFVLANASSPGLYHLEIKNTVKDLHGISLTGTYDVPKLVVSGDVTVGITRGLHGSTGNYVQYPEYTPPRENSVGFNPSDKVVTRVARLYYFRDAHRVAQIINRKMRSYNRHGVEMKNQLAGEALKKAEAATDLRKQYEKNAINAAMKTRQAESKLEDLQQALSRRSNETQQIQRDIQEMEADLNRKRFLESRDYANLPGLSDTEKKAEQEELRKLSDKIAAEQTVVQLERARLSLSTANTDSSLTRSRIQTAQAAVETARAEEIRLNDEWEVSQRKEERAYAEEFRKRVAAAHEDPDSYAEGVPASKDPVEQVSLSVIGTGLIQLRGPLKGVNEVRTMINQIDSPVGQVRITLHTVQINGEHADRMEKVALQIQRYIDHSRFLTMQSAQMLRNSIVKIASLKAAQVDAMCPEHSQHARDLKYVEAFFGADFLHALYELDSEFLKTGNKLLSLNSMDSTSLSSALFLMALAKNSVRMEILADFQMQIEAQLPQDEQDYFIASGMTKKHDFKKFHFLAQNAKFVSLRGFFNADVMGDDTLNPLQREFIRLAQIFKSRLVTEIELRERILERSVIEDRIGDYQKMMEQAQNEEEQARKSVDQAKEIRIRELLNLTQEFREMITILVQEVETQISNFTLKDESGAKEARAHDFANRLDELPDTNTYKTNKPNTIEFDGFLFNYKFIDETINEEKVKVISIISCKNLKTCQDLEKQERENKWDDMIQSKTNTFHKLYHICNKFNYSESEHQLILSEENYYFGRFYEKYCLPDSSPLRVKEENTRKRNVFLTLQIGIKEYSKLVNAIKVQTKIYQTSGSQILATLKSSKSGLLESYKDWLELRGNILAHYKDETLKANAVKVINQVNTSFQNMFNAELEEQIALQLLEGSRRPLDHKKFLDMLVDDVEEKYIDLIEGTRAHTANIDNYMQRIATALEDDFKTQYYDPAFRYVRETSRYWDVSFAQVEQTSILTNNRQFARVAPQATMEFDLPKRDILVNEAFESALAAYSDYGALLDDPNFLALTKLYGGQPASEIYTAEGFSPRIRNVLPGTPSVMDEEYLSQGPSGPPKFGSQLEGLIPDPAVYKFETGTAFEVRPVIQPDGQAVVFHLNYEYTTNIREPVRADEKHLGRVKRHFIDTDVQTGNYELREVSRYQVALKASRTSRGVPFLEDVPGLGVLFRPLPQGEASLQENIIMAQSVIYPTLFDIMGLRWAPAVADLDTISLRDQEFVTRNRQRVLKNKVSDFASGQVDGFLGIQEKQRRADLYRTQQTIPYNHPSGYTGPGLNIKDSKLQEGYRPEDIRPPSRYIPGKDPAFVPGTTEEWAPPAGSPRMQNIPSIEGAQPHFESEDSALFREHQSSLNQPQQDNHSSMKQATRIPGTGSPRSIPPAPQTPLLMAPPSPPATQNKKYIDQKLNPTSFEEEATPSRIFKFSSPLKALKNLNFIKSEPRQTPGHVRPIGYEKTSDRTNETQHNLFGIPSIVRPHQALPISTQIQKQPETSSLWSRFSEKLPRLPSSNK